MTSMHSIDLKLTCLLKSIMRGHTLLTRGNKSKETNTWNTSRDVLIDRLVRENEIHFPWADRSLIIWYI